MGGAIDAGGQVVLGPGVVLGAGLGVQYARLSKAYGADCSGGCAVSTDSLNRASKIVIDGGLSPRLLLALGYAF